MGDWEEELTKRAKTKPFLYVRYVDDIFGIWERDQEELLEFHKTANSICEQIQWI